MTTGPRRWLRVGIAIVVQLAIAAALFDAATSWYFRHPRRLAGVQSVARLIYGTTDRAVLQFDPAFARYDDELLYTLRPGRFVFAQHEFRTPFEVNRLGVRDDEPSLRAPEIVVAGDSVAMGWGVQQDETFAQIIERRTGRRVLNAGVPSYGTVREMRLLDRIDRSALRWLVVQYNANDLGENAAFQSHGNLHEGGPRAKYDRTMARYLAGRRYYPGRYSWTALTLLAGDLRRTIAPRRARGPAPTADQEADWFINALIHAGPVDLARTRVIVFEVTADGIVSSLVPTLRTRRTAGRLPAAMRDVVILDVARGLEPDDFYVLDDHPNARAHAKIADAILAAMGNAP